MQWDFRRACVDGISSLKEQGVHVKEKAQTDLRYPMIMLKELEKVCKAILVSQSTAQVTNWNYHKQLFGIF